MNTKYQPKSIVELSEDDYTVSLAKKFIESLDCKETIAYGIAYLIQAKIILKD